MVTLQLIGYVCTHNHSTLILCHYNTVYIHNTRDYCTLLSLQRLPITMAAPLKALTEPVQQLQADNSRFREEVTRISPPPPGGAGPSGNSTGKATTSVCFL